jgi:hypothetical protein
MAPSAPDQQPGRRRSLRCLLGFHNWVVRYNDAHERYDECRRCGKPGTYMPTGFGWQSIG